MDFFIIEYEYSIIARVSVKQKKKKKKKKNRMANNVAPDGSLWWGVSNEYTQLQFHDKSRKFP